ncbi:hypothetical protein Acor_64600 [Acrocarpospora corrugata]|uniref:Uncharacterized protein n=1 Tax=Acrocarpospora corrugata TaxID=35763 RepID=A0A5M3W8Q9_9ACTN|nr:hypothetical protein Acor_64600 [Acrocarpospora corrugata]
MPRPALQQTLKIGNQLQNPAPRHRSQAITHDPFGRVDGRWDEQVGSCAAARGTPGRGRERRAISVPLRAGGNQRASQAVIVVILIFTFGLHTSTQGIRDLVRTTGRQPRRLLASGRFTWERLLGLAASRSLGKAQKSDAAPGFRCGIAVFRGWRVGCRC